MKISFKYLLLFFAVAMMSIVACSDDDGEEPTPTPPPSGNGGGNGGGDQFENGIFAIVNQDSTDFPTFSATLDASSNPSIVRISGRNNAKSSVITITLGENFTGTFDASQPSGGNSISFEQNSIPFDVRTGTLVVTQNDTVVVGTFDFVGEPVFGSDTLRVTDGKFDIKL